MRALGYLCFKITQQTEQNFPFSFGIFVVIAFVFGNPTDQADAKAVEVVPFNVCACFAFFATGFNGAVSINHEVVADVL